MLEYLFSVSKEGVIINHPDTCPPFQEVPNTSRFVADQNLNRLQPLINKTIGFVGKTSQQIGKNFSLNFAEYQKFSRKKINSPILPYILRHNLHLPQFSIYDNDNGTAFLNRRKNPKPLEGLHGDLDPNSLLLVFRHPRPLEQFWRKKNMSKGSILYPTLQEMMKQTDDPGFRDELQEMKANIPIDPAQKPIEWGKFLRPAQNIIYRNVDQYVSSQALDFVKINGTGSHEVDEYHYMWSVQFPRRRRRR